MTAELLHIHPKNPELRKINKVVQVLTQGGLIVYPTDTVYGMGCDLSAKKAIARIAQIRQLRTEKLNLSFICRDLSQVSQYVRQLDNHVFKILKRYLPGPFTFILESSPAVARILGYNRKTVGIRIPDHAITQRILQIFDKPLLNASVKDDDTLVEYTADPEELYENFSHQADLVIDGGPGGNVPSTVVDLTGSSPLVLREGLGQFEG